MKIKQLIKVLRFLITTLALSTSIYAIIFNVLQVFGNPDPFYAPNRFVAFIYLIAIPSGAAILAWYFSFRKPLSGLVLSLILLVSPLYIYVSFQDTENNKNVNIYNNASRFTDNKLNSTDVQIAALQSQVADLSKKVMMLSSQLHSLDFAYDPPSLSSYMSSTDINTGKTTVTLPTLKFYPKGSHGGDDLLGIIDFRGVENMAKVAPQLFLTMALANRPTDLRTVTVDGKKYTFSSYEFSEGFPTDNSCFSGGGIINDLLTIEDRDLAFVVTRTYSEKGCEGTPSKISQTPSPEKVEELLRLIESVRFDN